MPNAPLPDADLTFTHRGHTLNLKPHRYSRTQLGPRLDDGIIDEVAVERRATGDLSTPLSAREVACLIFRLAVDERTDDQIADAFGLPAGKHARDLVCQYRMRHGIESHRPIGRVLDENLSRKQWAA